MSDKAKSARLDGFEARLRRIEQLLDEEPSDVEQVQRLQKRLAQQREVIGKLRGALISTSQLRQKFTAISSPDSYDIAQFETAADAAFAVLEETKGWDE